MSSVSTILAASLRQQMSFPGGRAYLHIPAKMSVGEIVQEISNLFSSAYPQAEILVITLSRITDLSLISEEGRERISLFQLTQISQSFVNTFLQSSDSVPKIIITESAVRLRTLQIPRQTSRILAVGTEFKSMTDLTETARFLSGPQAQKLNIKPLDVARFLGQIGYQIIDPNLDFSTPFHPISIQMTRSQYLEYLARVERERQLARREPFSALQATNFLYPPELQRLHNLPRESRPEIIPDLPQEEGGWITPEILQHIQEWSPKLEWLIRYLRLNLGKHIVYTAFSESNGVNAISTILRFAGFNTITVTGKDPIRRRFAKVNEFNQSEGTILISNLFAITGFSNVTSLTLFEQHPEIAVFDSYLRQIATTSDQRSLPVIFLIGVGPQNESTVDVEAYNESIREITQRMVILEILKTGNLNQPLQVYQQVFENINLNLADLQRIFANNTFKIQ